MLHSSQHQIRKSLYQSELKSTRLRTTATMSLHLSSLLKILLVTFLLPAVTSPRSIPPPDSQEQAPAELDRYEDTRQQLIGMELEALLRSNDEVPLGGEEEEVVPLRKKRAAAVVKRDPTLWPNQTIPFVFQEPFPRRYKNQVMKAISVWHKRTCIRFVDRTNEEYFAKFVRTDIGCNSRIGLKRYSVYRNSGQPVYLTVRCLQKRGIIIHELGHLIGFYHEHQRPDRDNYVQVQLENVAPSNHPQFEKLNFTTYGDYDFASIMHYSLHLYAEPESTGYAMTVLPNATVPEGVVIGSQHTLSRGDYLKARLMYQCPSKDAKLAATLATTSPAATAAAIATPPVTASETVAGAGTTDTAASTTGTVAATTGTTAATMGTTAATTGTTMGTTAVSTGTVATTTAPITISTPVATTPPPEVLSGNNIYAGEEVALMVNGTKFPENSWLSCTDKQCTVDKCLGKNFREENVRRCPNNVFNLHKIITGTTRRASGVVRVGDTVILERRHHAIRRSTFLYCNQQTKACSLSQVCVSGQSSYSNTQLCREHVLIVRAQGKTVGQAITHHDLIGFEFETHDHDSFFDQQCALGCDPLTKICSKTLCVFSASNSLPVGADLTQESQGRRVCGKDMFFVKKY